MILRMTSTLVCLDTVEVRKKVISILSQGQIKFISAQSQMKLQSAYQMHFNCMFAKSFIMFTFLGDTAKAKIEFNWWFAFRHAFLATPCGIC